MTKLLAALLIACALAQTASAEARPVRRHEATWYGMKGSTGACGVRLGTRRHRHYIAAHLPCGTRLVIRHAGRIAHGRVWDTGPFPAGDLDLAKVVFRQLAPLGAGRIRVSWQRRRR